MPDGHKSRMDQRSLLWIALGRQRVGKTALLNAAVQYFRALGCHIEIWNADQQNRTHSLSTFFADAAVPPAGGLADGKLWIEGQLCVFRAMPATDSDANQPVIPTQASHRFRGIPATPG